eukprot:scaffold431301_cov17-Prasinocladus_malaysianus.AAC.1
MVMDFISSLSPTYIKLTTNKHPSQLAEDEERLTKLSKARGEEERQLVSESRATAQQIVKEAEE